MSRYWADSYGLVNRLTPDGRVNHAPPERFGSIGNAHHIRLSRNQHEASDWDESFEHVFDLADTAFPGVIEWLAALEHVPAHHVKSREDRFHPVHASEDRLRSLVECLVSLAVRSPMNREAAVSLAEHYRGPLDGRERDALIGLNMRSCQRAGSRFDRNQRKVCRPLFAAPRVHFRRRLLPQHHIALNAAHVPSNPRPVDPRDQRSACNSH